VIASNHGGRVLAGVAPALAMLPAMRAALGPDYPLLFDGGIRSGSDALKALALGACAVLVGAPQLHALAVGGVAGVAHMLHILRTELELAMAQCGCATLADIDRELVIAL
jgi:isopentenyl diphosphate isomerase/L-lactate dehydrogenase-like FMN-dependent dehydrogenase